MPVLLEDDADDILQLRGRGQLDARQLVHNHSQVVWADLVEQTSGLKLWLGKNRICRVKLTSAHISLRIA